MKKFLKLETQFNDFKQEIQLNLTQILNNQQNLNDMMEDKFNTKLNETNQNQKKFMKKIQDKINSIHFDKTKK